MTETAPATRSGIDLFRERLKRAIDEADTKTLLAVLDVVDKEDDPEEAPYVLFAQGIQAVKQGRTIPMDKFLETLDELDRDG